MTSGEKIIKLKTYQGEDRVIHAEDKRKELADIRATKPKFLAYSGIPSLDKTTEGFRKGQLVVVSGPPKNGKTALCQTITKRMALDKQRTLWFSYELTLDELFQKFPKFDKDWMDFFVPRVIDSGNLQWVEDRIIEAKHKYGIEAVFIDHLDFLKDPEVARVNQNMSSYIGLIVQRVKRIAVEQELVIFLMTHLRKNNWTSNQLPSSEELRDTGQIAQLADLVLMVVRRRNDKKLYDENKAMVGVMENRHNGKTAFVDLLMVEKEFIEEIISKEEKEQREAEATAGSGLW